MARDADTLPGPVISREKHQVSEQPECAMSRQCKPQKGVCRLTKAKSKGCIMKLFYLAASLLVLAPAVVSAKPNGAGDTPTFGGAKVGMDMDYRWTDAEHTLPRIASSIDRKRGGGGYRARIGYWGR